MEETNIEVEAVEEVVEAPVEAVEVDETPVVEEVSNTEIA